LSVERIEENAVRAVFHINGLDGGQCFGVPHHDGFAAGESVIGFWIHRGSTGVYIGDFPNRLQRVQIEDRDPGRSASARNV
jgi:hypothetical protein